MKNKLFFKLLLVFTIFCCFNYKVKAEPIEEVESGEIEETKKSNDATLKDVVINSNNIVCSDYICEYEIKDNSVNKVVITYKPNSSKAVVSKDKIEGDIKGGLNEFTVTVKAEDETEKEYVFKINKKVLSTDSSLKSISVNGSNITLSSGNLKYNASVSYADKKLDIVAISNSDKAKVSLVDDKKNNFNNNKVSLDFFDETKTIKILVTAEAGDSSTYTITVTRREEKDASLKSLKIKNVSLNFESQVLDYEATVLKSMDKLEIEAIPNDKDAKVDIQGGNNLVIGNNTVTINVLNDGNSKTYTVKVNKLDKEDNSLANLKSLTIEGYEIPFKEDKYEYDLKIGNVNFLNIKAVPNIEESEIEITGNVDLVDKSIIKIKVIYDDETYNVYKINIEKEEEVIKENNTSKIVIVIAIILVVIAIVVILIIQIKNKKNKNNIDKANIDNNKNEEIKNKTVEEKVETSETVIKEKKTNIITLDDEEIEDII